MQINARQLGKQLQGRLLPIYIVAGDDPLLTQEACDLVRQAAQAAGCTEREVHHAEKNFDWNTLLESSSAMSLFGDKKLIEVRCNALSSIDNNGKKILQELAGDPIAENVILITTPKMDGKAVKAKWLSSMEQDCGVVQIWPVEGNAMPGWVKDRLVQRGIRPDHELVQLISEQSEGNLLAAQQEIEKIWLLYGDGDLDINTLQENLADNSRFNVFNLVDNALLGHADKAARIINELNQEGVNSTVVLWGLTREVRSIIDIMEAVNGGQSIDQAMKQAGIWQKRKPIVQSCLKRSKLKQMYSLLRLAWRCDQAIKSSDSELAWNYLSEITANLAGKPASFATRTA